MHQILVAHVVNSIVSTSHIKNDGVECELTKFLSTLNKLLKDYQKTFDLEDKLEMIGSDNLRTIVQESDFKKILNIHEDLVKIDTTPHTFQTTLSKILVDTALRYSDILTLEVNQLTEKYHSIDENAIEEPEEPIQPEVKQEGEPTSNPAGDEMEVDEVPPVLEVPEAQAESNDAMLADEKEAVDEKPEPEATTEVEKKQETGQTPTQEDNEVETAAEAGEEEAKAEQPQHPAIPEELEKTEEPTEPEREEPTGEAEAVADAYEQEHVDEKVEEEAAEKEKEASAQTEVSGQSSPKNEAAPPIAETPEPPAEGNAIGEQQTTPKRSDLIMEESRKRSQSPLAATQKHKRFQNIAVNLVKTIEEHRFSSPFLTPVNAREYEQVIYQPRDLKSILKAIRQKDLQPYETVKDLERDIMLMFANCVMYNKSNTHLVEMAIQMKNDVRKTFKMFEDAESGI